MQGFGVPLLRLVGRGMGKMLIMPPLAAIALYWVIGVRLLESPMSPERIGKALQGR